MKITIFDYSFILEDKFSSGHVLSANEAMALNGLRAENIRKRMTDKVKAAIDQNGGEILAPNDIERLQSIITDYAELYDFHPPSRRTAIMPLEIKIEIVAKEMADKAARQRGEISASDSEIESWKYHPQTQSEARRRLAESRQITSIEDL